MTGQHDIVFITGEVSGDRHAAPVVEELCRRGLTVTGIGGERMAAAGAEIVAGSTHWGAMGVPEALRKYPYLRLQERKVQRLLRTWRPTLVVLVDFGAFNVRVARYLRKHDLSRILYYFPPGSWRQTPRDWSPLAAITDCIATPFARNAEFLTASGANAHWVGHPVIDALQPPVDRGPHKTRLGLNEADTVVGVLPGSRNAERRLIGPLMLGAMRILRENIPSVQFLWSPFPGSARIGEPIQREAKALGGVTVVDESHDIMRAGDLLLTAMGTATLEAAAALTPMVTTYEGSTPAKWIAARLLRQAQPLYAMPNLMLGREAVPEVVPATASDRVTAERIAAPALDLVNDSRRRRAMTEDLREVRAMLGDPGVASRTADLVEALLADA